MPLPKLPIRLPTLPPSTMRCAAAVALALLPLTCLAASPGQTAAPPPADPVTLVRRAVQHRLDAEKTHKPAQYLIRRIDEHRDTTKLIVETGDGDVARLVAINGKPVSPDIDKGCPVRPLVLLTSGRVSGKTARMASASARSPAGVEVA